MLMLLGPGPYAAAMILLALGYAIFLLPSPRSDLRRIRQRFGRAGLRVARIERVGSDTVGDSPVRTYLAFVIVPDGTEEARKVGVEAVLLRPPMIWRMKPGAEPKVMLQAADAADVSD